MLVNVASVMISINPLNHSVLGYPNLSRIGHPVQGQRAGFFPDCFALRRNQGLNESVLVIMQCCRSLAGSGLLMMIFGGQILAYTLFRSDFVHPADLQDF